MVAKAENILSSDPVRFLITGVHFGHKNVGDEAILEGVITVLRNTRPNCKISVLTDEPDRTTALLGVKAYRFSLYNSAGPGIMNRIFRILARILENILHALIVYRTDIVICAGGTILSDAPATVIRISSIAIAADKRIIYFPGGMNSGNSPEILERLMKVSREFDLFLTRDSDTKDRLVRAGWERGQLFSTVDPAFNLKVRYNTGDTAYHVPWFSEDLPVVAIGVSSEPDCAEHNRAQDWAEIADFIVDEFGARVLFLPSNTQPEKDLLIMRAVHEAMKQPDKAMLIEDELQPKVMIATIAKLEVMISSRMHQLIFSAIANTPFVGVSRCEKTDTFLSFFGMKAAATTKNCRLEILQPVFETVWDQRERMKKHIAEITDTLFDKSRETEVLVGKCLYDLAASPPSDRPLLRRFQFLARAFFMRMGKGVEDTKKGHAAILGED